MGLNFNFECVCVGDIICVLADRLVVGFECVQRRACACPSIELCPQSPGGVCDRVRSYGTPVAAGRRLIVCTGAGVRLM